MIPNRPANAADSPLRRRAAGTLLVAIGKPDSASAPGSLWAHIFTSASSLPRSVCRLITVCMSFCLSCPPCRKESRKTCSAGERNLPASSLTAGRAAPPQHPKRPLLLAEPSNSHPDKALYRAELSKLSCMLNSERVTIAEIYR